MKSFLGVLCGQELLSAKSAKNSRKERQEKASPAFVYGSVLFANQPLASAPRKTCL